MKKIFLFLLIILLMGSCRQMLEDSHNTKSGITQKNPPKILYEVKYGFGNSVYFDYSISEIEYLDSKIRFVSYNHGRPDTIIIGGSYRIQRYKEDK